MSDHSLSVSQKLPPKPFGIAAHEQLEFVRLPKKEQVRIIDLLDAFKTISAFEGKKGDAFASIAAVNGGRKGFSAKSLERLYAAYLKSGYDWGVLTRKWRGSKPGQPREFKDFIVRLALECRGRTDVIGGVCARLFHDFWAAGKPVPGYGTFKDFWDATQPNSPYPSKIRAKRPFVPQGWSRGNIQKLIAAAAPRKGAMRLRAAFGELRAHDAEAQLRRDMSNLKPMQLVTMDDVELDIQVLFKIGPYMRLRTAQAVVAMDVASRMIIGWGVRPILTDKDLPYVPEGSGKVLTRKDVNAVLLSSILRYGLPANYPMRLLLENNSARLNKLDESMLMTMLPGRLVIENTRMSEREFANYGLIDKHGFPFQKGWLESAFKLLHIRLCHLPGATAPRFDDRHSVHEKIIEYCEALEKRASAKGIDMSRLKFPALTEEEFFLVFERIVNIFNNRTNHKLQGFQTVYECLLPNAEYCRRENLPPTLSATELAELNFESRPESPFERWTRLRAQNEFTRIETPALYPCMCDKRLVKVRNGEIKTEISSFRREPLYFRSLKLRELEGRELIAAFTPDHKTAWLFTKDEGFLCGAPSVDFVDITDQEAIIRQSGIVHRDRMIEAKKMSEHLSEIGNTYREIRIHNEAVLENNAQIGEAMAAAEIREKTLSEGRRIADFSDTSRLVGVPSVTESSDGGLDDFADSSDLI